MKFELGEIIAKRSLKAVYQDSSETVIQVLLGTPSNFVDSTDVFAPYQIEFRDKRRLWRAAGIDGFQALHLAMKMIVVEIETLERRHQIRVLWKRDRDGNLVFNDF